MRKGAVAHFLQFGAMFLMGFLVFYILISWLGGGYAAATAIEKEGLKYAISTASNSLSIMDEGYVIKELLDDYDITIAKMKRENDETNFYVHVKPSFYAGTDDLVFSEGDKTCGTSRDAILSAEYGAIRFSGRVETKDICRKLEPILLREGNKFTVMIQRKNDKSMTNCDRCSETGAIEFEGKITNLIPGTYEVTIIGTKVFQGFKFTNKPGDDDVVLAQSREIEVTEGDEFRELSKSELEDVSFLLHDVQAVGLTNVDCLKIIKEPGELVKYEKCTKGIFYAQWEEE